MLRAGSLSVTSQSRSLPPPPPSAHCPLPPKVRRRAGSAISVISFECAEKIVSAGLLTALCTSANSQSPPSLLLAHGSPSDLLSEGHLAQSQACSMLEALVSVSEKVNC